ncbi:phosphotransferase [Streptomyces sp. Act-28]
MVPTTESTLRRTYPHHTWHLVDEGDSGAFVHHLTGRGPELHAKIVPRSPENPAFDHAGEADRLDWLTRHGVPVPRVVERGADDTTAWLVTEAVPGVAASEEWPEHQRAAVVVAIAELARTLHELPVDDCPFGRRLDVADRHADLALAARELAIDEGPWFGPEYAERFLERYGAHRVDQERTAFHQLLDEFF